MRLDSCWYSWASRRFSVFRCRRLHPLSLVGQTEPSTGLWAKHTCSDIGGGASRFTTLAWEYPFLGQLLAPPLYQLPPLAPPLFQLSPRHCASVAAVAALRLPLKALPPPLLGCHAAGVSHTEVCFSRSN